LNTKRKETDLVFAVSSPKIILSSDRLVENCTSGERTCLAFERSAIRLITANTSTGESDVSHVDSDIVEDENPATVAMTRRPVEFSSSLATIDARQIHVLTEFRDR